ncbi:MAG: 2-oxoacid:acceptor oxidoreductase family protein [Sulfolobales archaeon]
MRDIYEIRWHGRGGQGAVTGSIILAEASNLEGLYSQAFPEFGPERRGAPVTAYTRISKGYIRTRAPIENPDIVVVLDPSIPASTYLRGLKRDGYVVINTKKSARDIAESLGIRGVVSVDGTSLALKILGSPIVNIAMLGALARILDIVSINSIARAILKILYNIEASGSLDTIFKSPGLGEAVMGNIAVLSEAYRSAEVFL